MPGLVITDPQAAIILATDPYEDTAFLSGVVDPGATIIVQPMQNYNLLTGPQAVTVRQIFNDCLAAFTKAMNLTAALPTGLTTTVTLAKLTGGGSNGSLTFTDGILTAKVDPT